MEGVIIIARSLYLEETNHNNDNGEGGRGGDTIIIIITIAFFHYFWEGEGEERGDHTSPTNN